jgi:tetratricopeptide (TPR) repeat protein
MSADAHNPWLGLLPYGESDAPFFHGRAGETDELLALIERDTLSVLYGISGLGKTSLIHAGLLPRKSHADALPLVFRINHDYVENCEEARGDKIGPKILGRGGIQGHLLEHFRHFTLDRAISALPIDPQAEIQPSLWEYFHHRDGRWWSSKNRPLTPVIIFDQFEEIFTLGQGSLRRMERTEAFLEELSALIYNRPPPHVLAAVERGEEVPFDFEAVPLRVLLALREDFLPHLAGLREHGFPTVRRNEMRLLPMSKAAAREVIEIPGHELLDDGVGDDILAFVAGKTGEVEPALLSVVLRELNEKRRAAGLPHITRVLLSGSKEAIVSDFYKGAFAGLEPAVRLFVENELVSPGGFRDSRALDDALSRAGMTRVALDTLVDRRLLRYEDRAGGARRVELAHDLLCSVTAASRAARAGREAEALRLAGEERKRKEAEAAARAAAEQAAIQRQQLHRARRIAVGFAVLGLLAVAAFLLAFEALRRAQDEKERAQKAEAAAGKEKDNAQAQQRLAEAAKKSADELIQYMQFDLSNLLQDLGKQQILQEVNTRVRRYYKEYPPDSHDASALYLKSLALRDQGRLDGVKNDYEKALSDYQESRKTLESLLEQRPDDPYVTRELVEVICGIGDMQKNIGNRDGRKKDVADALQGYEEARSILNAQRDRPPAWSQLLASCYNRMGDAYTDLKQPQDALNAYQSSLSVLQEFAPLDQASLPLGYYRVAMALHGLGRLHESRAEYELGVDAVAKVVQKQPENFTARSTLAVFHYALSEVCEDQGDLKEAISHAKLCLDLRRGLNQQDDQNGDWVSGLYEALVLSGNLEVRTKAPREALAHFKEALETAKRLIAINPSNSTWQQRVKDMEEVVARSAVAR